MDIVIPAEDGNQEMCAEDPEEDKRRGMDNFENDAADEEGSLLLLPRFIQPEKEPLDNFLKKMFENNVSHELHVFQVTD